MLITPHPPHAAPAPPAASPTARGDGGRAGDVAVDRVEISDAGRSRSASPARTASLEMEVARLALRAGARLDGARLQELRERFRTGYYDAPAVVDRIGEAAARDLVRARLT